MTRKRIIKTTTKQQQQQQQLRKKKKTQQQTNKQVRGCYCQRFLTIIMFILILAFRLTTKMYLPTRTSLYIHRPTPSLYYLSVLVLSFSLTSKTCMSMHSLNGLHQRRSTHWHLSTYLSLTMQGTYKTSFLCDSHGTPLFNFSCSNNLTICTFLTQVTSKRCKRKRHF